jgi:hypothetical protein
MAWVGFPPNPAQAGVSYTTIFQKSEQSAQLSPGKEFNSVTIIPQVALRLWP